MAAHIPPTFIETVDPMADHSEAPAVFSAENNKTENHHIIIGVGIDADEAHLKEMVKAAKDKYSAGDMVHIIHVVGEHESHIRGRASAPAQAKEEEEARAYIAQHVEPLLKEQNMEYKVEIHYGQWTVETIGAIISKRANDLDASLVVLSKAHHNFLQDLLIGSVSKWVSKHTKAPVSAV